jgi:hypothetical protein
MKQDGKKEGQKDVGLVFVKMDRKTTDLLYLQEVRQRKTV